MILSNNSSNYSNNISLKCDLFYKRLHYSTYVSVLRLKMVGVIYATYNWIMVIVNYEHCVIDINIKFIKHNRYYIYIQNKIVQQFHVNALLKKNMHIYVI